MKERSGACPNSSPLTPAKSGDPDLAEPVVGVLAFAGTSGKTTFRAARLAQVSPVTKAPHPPFAHAKGTFSRQGGRRKRARPLRPPIDQAHDVCASRSPPGERWGRRLFTSPSMGEVGLRSRPGEGGRTHLNSTGRLPDPSPGSLPPVASPTSPARGEVGRRLFTLTSRKCQSGGIGGRSRRHLPLPAGYGRRRSPAELRAGRSKSNAYGPIRRIRRTHWRRACCRRNEPRLRSGAA